jgi:hypothetical protein
MGKLPWQYKYILIYSAFVWPKQKKSLFNILPVVPFLENRGEL